MRNPRRRRDPANPRAAQHGREHPPTTPPSAGPAQPSPASDDTRRGLVLMIMTVGGALAMVPAVWLIALVSAVWAAAFAFLILLALTGTIIFTVLRAASS